MKGEASSAKTNQTDSFRKKKKNSFYTISGLYFCQILFLNRKYSLGHWYSFQIFIYDFHYLCSVSSFLTKKGELRSKPNVNKCTTEMLYGLTSTVKKATGKLR